MKRLICLILAVIIPLSVLSGCGKKSRNLRYNSKVKVTNLTTCCVAENDKYSLNFDSDNKTISLVCKETGKEWTNYSSDDDCKSTLNIRVQDTRVVKESTYESSSAKKITSEEIKDGIKLTYYFDSVKISIPVCYTLRDDSVLISVTGKDICEGDERYQLIAVLPSPMLCSVSVEAEDSYLFVPNGLGGIVSNKSDADMIRKSFGTGANFASMETESSTNDSDSTGFRCFGVKEGTNAAFCIAEDTPGAVGVNLLAGDRLKSEAYVYPTFAFTDYDYFYGISVTDGLIKQVSDLYLGTISVGFYPLSGDDANYNGMANLYREYLTKKGFIKENKQVEETSPYAVTYLGGVMSTNSILGIPTQKLQVMTSFDDAKSDTQELYELTGIMPTVRLSGYGETGINVGKVAGGYTFDSAFGKKNSRISLQDYVTKNNSEIFSDFRLLAYKKSGSGFSYSRDYARTAVLHAAEISPVNIPLRDFNKKLKYRLISRSSIGKAVDKLVDMAEKTDVSGISLKDLGAYSYSDYSNGVKYAVTAKMDTDTKKQLEKLANTKHKIGVSSATYFAAGLTDVVFDAPVEPNGKYMYSNEIPFYQMVFHGVTPMYSSAINTATDINYKIMLAASSGTGLGFSVINNFDSSYMETNAAKLYGMLYTDTKDLIVNSMEKYAKIYKTVEKSKILSYDILDNNITKTTFDNGVSIYANHSSSKSVSPVGELDGYDFIMDGGAEQ